MLHSTCHPERRRSRSRRIYAFTATLAAIQCVDPSISLRSTRDDSVVSNLKQPDKSEFDFLGHKGYTNPIKGGDPMAISNYFPIWDKLTAEQQKRIADISDFRKISSGTLLHDGSPDCLGMILVRSWVKFTPALCSIRLEARVDMESAYLSER